MTRRSRATGSRYAGLRHDDVELGAALADEDGAAVGTINLFFYGARRAGSGTTSCRRRVGAESRRARCARCRRGRWYELGGELVAVEVYSLLREDPR